jgi:Holliday junction resolvase RusA-like endonuclease
MAKVSTKNYQPRRGQAAIRRRLRLHNENESVSHPPIEFKVETEKLCSKPRMTRCDVWKKRPVVERWFAYKDLVALTYRRSGGKTYFHPVSMKFEFFLSGNRRTDLDNLIKAVIDALVGLAFPDDSVKYIRRYDSASVTIKEKGQTEAVWITIKEIGG